MLHYFLTMLSAIRRTERKIQTHFFALKHYIEITASEIVKVYYRTLLLHYILSKIDQTTLLLRSEQVRIPSMMLMKLVSSELSLVSYLVLPALQKSMSLVTTAYLCVMMQVMTGMTAF